MGNFKQSNKFSGRGNRGGFSDRNSGRPAMHETVCSECGKKCEVPFKPTGDKPVYCSDCFKGKEKSEPRGFGGRRDSGRRDFGRRDSGRFNSNERKMHEAVCSECGRTCEVPFKPTGDKPVYCSDCFEGKGGRDSNRDNNSGVKDKNFNQDNKRLNAINEKLDKILKMLTPAKPVVFKEKKEEEKIAVKEKKKVSVKKKVVKPTKLIKDKKKKVVSIKKKTTKPKKK